MGVLSNPRHELFAQALAEGKTADAAYQDAGFRANRGNAGTLKAKQHISSRVAELQGALANARLEQVAITAGFVTDNIVRIARRAEEIESNYGPSALSVARASWMDAAKLNGLVVEKSEGSLNLSVCRSLLELAED